MMSNDNKKRKSDTRRFIEDGIGLIIEPPPKKKDEKEDKKDRDDRDKAEKQKPKDIEIDLLAIDLKTGSDWLHRAQRDRDKAEEIRARHRQQWLDQKKSDSD